MPKGIEGAIRSGYAGKGLSKKEVDTRVYGALNNQGLMHGSKETAKGKKAEAKFEADRKKKR